MTPESWRRAQEVFHAAREREAGLRAAFVETECAGDLELKTEVESLLATFQAAPSSFLESPAIEAAPPVPQAPRALGKGTRLGPYEILSPLGAGGMGEVYRAKDERLGREVAIKVLSGELAADSERLRRFEKEARSASALNHPNIVTIHDIGTSGGVSYIAMEKVEGETLRALVNGPLALKRLLQIAPQIANGLARAHEAGIVHRDLKPENVMVTRDGLVKILDFGLAKLTSAGSGSDEGSRLPTMSGTTPGVVVGTVGYMSPEQANGEKVDYRSDQFSFGSMLYEMATGKRAFQKKTAIDTLGAILNEEPEAIATLNPKVPAPLRWIVARCLAKESRSRYASTEDLARELATVRDHLSEATSGAGSLGVKAAPRRRWGWAVAGALVLIAGGLGYLLANKTSNVELPQFTPITFNQGWVTGARFTPDGQSVVYSAAWEGKPLELYSIRLGNPESVPLGLPPAHLLSIGRNGDMALLMDAADRGAYALGTLARAPLGGGAPRQVTTSVSDADWGPDGQLALLRWTEDTEVLEYPAGKVLYEIRRPKDSPAAAWMRIPRVSPDGRSVAFLEHSILGDFAGAVVLVDLAGRKKVISAGWSSVWGLSWSPKGDELWFSAGGRPDKPGLAIRAVSLSGGERAIATGPGSIQFRDLSRDGRILATREVGRNTTVFGGRGLERERDLSWSDTSDSQPTALSADGKKLLFLCAGGACLRDTDGGPVVRLGRGFPVGLSPDGTWVSTLNAGSDVLTLVPTGPGEPKPVALPGLEGALTGPWPEWTPDSRHLVVSAKRGKEDRRCFLVDLEGGTPRPVTPEGTGTGRGFDCWPSPDGKWVTARRDDDTLALYPLGSGEPRFVAGLTKNDHMAGWSADSRFVFAQTQNPEWPIRVSRLDVETGRREFWKDFAPSDPAGVDGPQGKIGVRVTPDGRFYVFSVQRFLSELYVVDRAR